MLTFFGETKSFFVFLTTYVFLGANFELKNSDGETPLQISVAKGYTHIVKLLHKKGAQINTTNYRRQTPLHQASEKGFQNIVEYLIQNGADLECQDGVGRTPLQVIFKKIEK